MIKNNAIVDKDFSPNKNTAAHETLLFKKQLEAMVAITSDYIDGKQDETTFE